MSDLKNEDTISGSPVNHYRSDCHMICDPHPPTHPPSAVPGVVAMAGLPRQPHQQANSVQDRAVQRPSVSLAAVASLADHVD